MVRLRFFTIALVVLAMLAMVGCERKIEGDVSTIVDNSTEDCLGCHSGFLDAAQGEWANSIHASGSNIDYTNRTGSDCMVCHDQQGFLEFIETGALPSVPLTSVSAIGCFTCHNPHENGDMSLNTTAAYVLKDGDVFDHGAGNLCANCHHSRTDVRTIGDDQSTNSRFGPHHGPQGDMINGSGGYEFPGLSYTFPNSPHATQVRDACVGCHMGQAQQHEGYLIGGHSWNMVDEESGYSLSGLCADAACHPDVTTLDFTADADYDNDGATEGYQTEFEGLMDSLAVLLTDYGVLSGSGSPTSGTIADGHVAGALYNYVTMEEDRSFGVHNWNYMRSLLEASIDYMAGAVVPGSVDGVNDNSVAVVSSH
jgi:hypothetical protein